MSKCPKCHLFNVIPRKKYFPLRLRLWKKIGSHSKMCQSPKIRPPDLMILSTYRKNEASCGPQNAIKHCSSILETKKWDSLAHPVILFPVKWRIPYACPSRAANERPLLKMIVCLCPIIQYTGSFVFMSFHFPPAYDLCKDRYKIYAFYPCFCPKCSKSETPFLGNGKSESEKPAIC